MGIFLSLLYFVMYYLTPEFIFGQLAELRIELIVAVLVILVSVPRLVKTFLFKTPQLFAIIGYSFASAASLLVTGWIYGSLTTFVNFAPNIIAFFLVCLNFNSYGKLKILIGTLLLTCLFIIGMGCFEIRKHGAEIAAAQDQPAATVMRELQSSNTNFLLASSNGKGAIIFRMMGLGEINDPNDFAQLLISVLPLTFIFWRIKSFVRNFFLVLIPAGVLIFGIYMTHSRGALLALMVILILAVRPRIGTIASVLLAGVVFAGSMALHFTGDRDISADAGSDRTQLWGEGMEMLKGNPIFGVGAGNMPDHTDNHLTAHNSIVVCAAETGMLGLFFWSMFMVSSISDSMTASSPDNVSEFPKVEDKPKVSWRPNGNLPPPLTRQEINSSGRLATLSMAGYLTCGWFLSRTMVLTFPLIAGIATISYQMALDQDRIVPRRSTVWILKRSFLAACGLVLLMYIMLRVANIAR